MVSVLEERKGKGKGRKGGKDANGIKEMEGDERKRSMKGKKRARVEGEEGKGEWKGKDGGSSE